MLEVYGGRYLCIIVHRSEIKPKIFVLVEVITMLPVFGRRDMVAVFGGQTTFPIPVGGGWWTKYAVVIKYCPTHTYDDECPSM